MLLVEGEEQVLRSFAGFHSAVFLLNKDTEVCDCTQVPVLISQLPSSLLLFN